MNTPRLTELSKKTIEEYPEIINEWIHKWVANHVKSIDKQKELFRRDIEKEKNGYQSDMLNEFYQYWTEPNKTHTKILKEMQKTWSTSLRLKRWKRNDFNKTNETPQMTKSPFTKHKTHNG